MSKTRSPSIEEYRIGLICALPKEMKAVRAMMDQEHDCFRNQEEQDGNSYILGRIHEHNVVAACLPTGVYGTTSAAIVATNMLRTFTNLRYGLMVGIGGGIPSEHNDIRLGDIVISVPNGEYGGVVQYDLGKNLGKGKFKHKGSLDKPPQSLLTALSMLQSDPKRFGIQHYLTEMYDRHSDLTHEGYSFPGIEKDHLYCNKCDNSWRPFFKSCQFCKNGEVKRLPRRDVRPIAHYGIIASGNQLIKDSTFRDFLGQEYGALCVEMEAAGLDNFPSLVIRGICDYADRNKNDDWQEYAAATAAAFAKDLLQYISPEAAKRENPSQESTGYQDDEYRLCHQSFKTTPYEERKNINPPRVDGTCQWVLNHERFIHWNENSRDDLLWISADPGCGKSVLSRSLVENELQSSATRTVCYFFFKDNEEQDSLVNALCAILHQLFDRQPQLIQYALPAWRKNGMQAQKEVPELWRTLLEASRGQQASEVICVLDALDECRTSHQRQLIQYLTHFYLGISASPSTVQGSRLKFLVTSRPYDDIQLCFEEIPNHIPAIRLQGELENDQIHTEIDLVINLQVNKLVNELRLDLETGERLRTKLLQMHHRTYLWLYLAIRDIYYTFQNSLRPHQAEIEALPSSVDEAYVKILDRIEEKERGKAKKVLMIIVGSKRPLTIGEMAIALGISSIVHPESSTYPESLEKARLDPSWLEGRIRGWCGLFVFFNHSKIYLIHQTAKEFLFCTGTASQTGWKHCIHPLEVEREMTQICVEFLCLRDIEPTAQALLERFDRSTRLDSILDENNDTEIFLAYAAEHWPNHFRDACIPVGSALVNRVLRLYDTTSSIYEQWVPVFWYSFRRWDTRSQINDIILAAIFRHKELLEMKLQNRPFDIDLADSYGWTALVWASELGFLDVSIILVNRGAEVTARAVEYAAYEGYEDIVEFLVNRGAEVTATAVENAASRDHKDLIEWLVDERSAKVTPEAVKRALYLDHEDLGKWLMRKFTLQKVAKPAREDDNLREWADRRENFYRIPLEPRASIEYLDRLDYNHNPYSKDKEKSFFEQASRRGSSASEGGWELVVPLGPFNLDEIRAMFE